LVAEERDAVAMQALELPTGAGAVCFYRDGAFALIDAETRLHKGDEVVILTHGKNLAALRQRRKPRQAR
jgi:trk/ktr system potassium uptake protein